MENIKEKVQELQKCIEDNCPQVDALLTYLEEWSQVKKIWWISGFLASIALWLMFGYGAQLVCNAIGFVYPAYCSIKALETARKDDDTQWLVYWVVFALFSVIEFFSDILVGWIPLYWFCKCAFLIWCMSPMDGASRIYHSIILQWYKKNHTTIDTVLDEGKKVADKIVNEGMEQWGRVISSIDYTD